ncbi:hypothetical protein RND81_13G139300 [Saponaria officinalis]|uniref:Retrotransposon Copia-like N-terminal domain-containing protein n=1 Tax=Saponaria officinalis TaxID=3572 RepID=A0AAW1H0S8_SAPOF
MSNSENNSASSKYETFYDPLYLSPSDQPTIQIVSCQFNGYNFVTWKRDVYHALVAKNKAGFVDGTCKIPSKTDATYHQWIRCDLFVMKWILNSVERNIRESLQHVSSAQELWTEISDRYDQSNSIEIYHLKKDLASITQDNTSLVEYYNKLKRTWECIDVLDPLSLCTCKIVDGCTCQMLKRIVDREVSAKLIQFLMGLNHAYDNFKTHILTLDPLPPLNKAFALLQKIESQKHLDDNSDINADAAVFNSVGLQSDSSPGRKRPKLVTGSAGSSVVKECHYCHNLGHTKAERFKLRECSYCGNKGHARETCYRLKFGPNNGGRSSRGQGRNSYGRGQNFRHSANVAVEMYSEYTDEYAEDIPSDPLSDTNANTNDTDFDPQMVNGLVSTVMEQVMKAISEKNTGDKRSSDKRFSGMSSVNFAGIVVNTVLPHHETNSSLDWIIDTGASDHMTPSVCFLSNVKTLLKPVIVGLPDGTMKQVQQIGDYSLTPDIQLCKVLVVPGFQHNLISVGRLLEHSHLTMTFYPHHCVFQDPVSDKRVAVAGKEAGL